MRYWKLLETDADLSLMSRVLGVSEIMAQVMANRGLRTKKTAQAFLSPSLHNLRDPLTMKDAERALTYILQSAARQEKMMIYGDYDADGVIGTVILYKTLKRYGADVDYYIPHRAEEGYGLNLNAVRRMKEQGVDLIITVDNGISALSEVAEANRLGMRVVIFDHHEPGFVERDDTGAGVDADADDIVGADSGSGIRVDVIPDAEAVVDPKQSVCSFPFKSLCAAGIAFKLAGAFCRLAGIPFTEHDELLALAAIATVCDIVALQDENRVIVKNGLEVLNRHKLINPGLGSLIVRRGYLDKPVDAFTAGFILGPCINATGRLESAALSVQLLLAPIEDERTRLELAQRLTELNEERKAMTADSTERVLASLAQCERLDKVLVLVDTDAHESVAGIVAGRVREAVNRPTILLTHSFSTGQAMAQPAEEPVETPDGEITNEVYMKGSGRSIDGYNLFEALYKCRHLFVRFGGHAMAAGLTIPEENVALLRTLLNEACVLTEEDFHATVYIDRVLDSDEITLALSEELAQLAPFGKGNREPLFATYGLPVESLRIMDEKNTLIFTFLTRKRKWLKGIGFSLNSRFAEALAEVYDETEIDMIRSGRLRDVGLVMDLVYGIETNVYNGIASVQMRIRDFILNRIG